MTDLIILASFVIILGLTRTRDAMAVSIVFLLTVWYTSSQSFDVHPAWLNHTIEALIVAPAMYFVCKPVCVAMFVYASVQWLGAGNYIFAGSEDIMYIPFYSMAVASNVYTMATLIYVSRNRSYNTSLDLAPGWLPCMLRSAFFAKEAK